jgi:hypothetical protein
MGAWGTAISSNDTYADVYADFFDLYNEGWEVKDISKKLVDDNGEIIEDEDDANNFWFALAKAQWECKQLDGDVFQRVKQIVESGADLEVWRNLGASNSDLKKRKAALDKFLVQLQTDNPKSRRRKKKRIVEPVYKKGDCLAYKLENGNYGGAIVLEAVYGGEYGLNLIAALQINQPQIPDFMDFEKSNVLVMSFALWNEEPAISWMHAFSLKKDKVKPEVVANIEVQRQFNPNDFSDKFTYGGSINNLIEVARLQFEHEKSGGKTAEKIPIRNFTSSNK